MYALSLGLFCALALPCAITAASVPVSSGKDMALMPIKNGPVLRVDPDQNPDWAGEINPLDCKRVRTLMGGRVAFYPPTEKFMFWSRIGRSVPPPGNEFELPFGFTYSECFHHQPVVQFLILSPMAFRDMHSVNTHGP